MRLVLVGFLVLFLATPAGAAPREADPAWLATIVDDLPPSLPRGLAPHERGLPLPQIPDEPLAPPPTIPRAQAEYEPNHGILIRWGNYNELLAAMVVPLTTADPPSDVWVVVSGSTQQASATSTLQSGGADLTHVRFVVAATDTVWIRDYGPRFIADAGRRAIADHTYNRPRPNDNLFPGVFAAQLGETRYAMPLVHGGGNFHLFRNREAFMTRLVANENPSLSEQQIKDLYFAYQGLDLTLTDPLPACFDSTQHIDMWMLPLGDDKVLISEYDETAGCRNQQATIGVPKAVTDATANLLQSRGYTVYRVPGSGSTLSTQSAHYTYTNAVIVNQVVLICRFGGAHAERDAQARATFEAAMPGHHVIQVNCANIIGSSGAIHCIVMHVPDLLFREEFDLLAAQPR